MSDLWDKNAKFNPEQAVYVNKQFHSELGKLYSIGDHFDWRELNITERRAKLMFEQRYLTHKRVVPLVPEGTNKVPKVKGGK